TCTCKPRTARWGRTGILGALDRTEDRTAAQPLSPSIDPHLTAPAPPKAWSPRACEPGQAGWGNVEQRVKARRGQAKKEARPAGLARGGWGSKKLGRSRPLGPGRGHAWDQSPGTECKGPTPTANSEGPKLWRSSFACPFWPEQAEGRCATRRLGQGGA